MARFIVLALAGIAAFPGASVAAGWSVLEWGVSRPSVAAFPPFPQRGVLHAAATAQPESSGPRGSGQHAVTATIARDMRGAPHAARGESH